MILCRKGICVTDMQQNGVFDLLKCLELMTEEAIPIIPNRWALIKPQEFLAQIDRIYASLPLEIQEARAFLRRRDELQMEAQQKAEKIIADAQMEADRKLSEADFIKAVEREGIRIRNQVQEECEELKRRALEEADQIRSQAADDAIKTKEGAELYAEQVLTNIEQDLNKLQQVVKNGQIYMEQLRSGSGTGTSYQTATSNYKTPDYVMK